MHWMQVPSLAGRLVNYTWIHRVVSITMYLLQPTVIYDAR